VPGQKTPSTIVSEDIRLQSCTWKYDMKAEHSAQ
jgi:hypothetical protein